MVEEPSPHDGEGDSLRFNNARNGRPSIYRKGYEYSMGGVFCYPLCYLARLRNSRVALLRDARVSARLELYWVCAAAPADFVGRTHSN
eukprot:6188575-Pleurochrysis_carterae.AAC.1